MLSYLAFFCLRRKSTKFTLTYQNYFSACYARNKKWNKKFFHFKNSYLINIVKIHVLTISIFLLHISNMHTHKLEMYTIYDISLHNINIFAIIPFEKLEY